MKRPVAEIVLLGLPCLLAGCMGGEPESTIKLTTQPMKAPVTLAPNVLVQRRLESADQRPSTKTMVPAPSPMPAKVAPAARPSSSEPSVKAANGPRPDRLARADEEKKQTKDQETPLASPKASTPEPKEVVTPTADVTPKLDFKKASLPSDIPSWFSENDRDSDGMVGLHEWPKDKRSEFRKYDHNGDALITIDEAMRTVPRAKVASSTSSPVAASVTSTSSAAPPSAGQAIPGVEEKDRLAAEGSIRRYGNKRLPNKVTQEEMPFFYKKDRFAEFDKDRDGGLDVAELAAFLKATTGAATEVARGDGDSREGSRGENREGSRPEGRDFGRGGENREGRGNRDPDQWARNMFRNLDKKGAGKITKEEIPEYMRTFKSKFEENDVNKDGTLDFEEFKAGMSRGFRRGG